MWSWKRDPVTGDLIPDGKGGWQKTNTAEVVVQNDMLTQLGPNWAAPGRGSLLSNLDRFNANPEVLVPEEARRALARLVAAGRIANVEVRAERASPTRIHVQTRFRDTTTSTVVTTKINAGR